MLRDYIFAYLSRHHVGRCHAIKRVELLAYLKANYPGPVDDRAMREAVASNPLILVGPKGYWIPTDEEQTKDARYSAQYLYKKVAGTVSHAKRIIDAHPDAAQGELF